MKQKLIIQNWTIDLNTYIEAERSSRFEAAKIKKEWTELVMMEAKAQKLKPMKSPVSIVMFWAVPNAKKDKDNISSIGKKFFLDGLVKAGILKDDGWNDIDMLVDLYVLMKGCKPSVSIDLRNDE